MNMNSIFKFAVEVINLFASWFSFNEKEWAWSPVRVDNHNDRF